MSALRHTLGALAVATIAAAQEPMIASQFALQGPRFLSTPKRGAPLVDMSMAPALQRRVSLVLDAVPLGAALAEIARQTGLHFGSSPQLVPLGRHVSVSAANLTVGAALFELLAGLGIDVFLSSDGTTLVLAPRASSAAQRQALGRLAGHVTDATSGKPIPYAMIIVEGTRYRATTAANGEYAIGEMAAGAYQVTARLLGYAPATKPVVIANDSTARVDFALAQMPVKLEEIVTTGAGAQRRIEVGNAIATIEADSVAQTAPVTSLSDLIEGRAANVQVLENSGLVGAGPRIRIRGLNSAFLSNDPILIVDGVRVDASQGNASDVSPVSYDQHHTSSRFNDIDPQEIESVEVLRGPSAATEYGTDAANGVIVVKTKHGHAGAPRWDFFAEQGLSTMPARFPTNYYNWGHTTDASHTPVQCLTFASYTNPSAPTLGAGTCATDSLTSFNPLANSNTSIFGTGSHAQYSAQVSGGNAQTTYALNAGYTGDDGLLRMPPAEASAILAQGQTIAPYEANPNTLHRTNLHANLRTTIGTVADVSVNAGYVASGQRAPDDNIAIDGALVGKGYADSLDGYGPADRPRNVFKNTTSEDIGRFTGGLTAAWHPFAWLNTHATVGLDAGDRTQAAYVPIGPDASYLTDGSGYRGLERTGTNVYTIDVGASGNVAPWPLVGARTSAGVQYTRQNQTGTLVQAYILAPGGQDLTGAARSTSSEIDNVIATLGTYIEETISFDQRLFLTGAVRIDAGSGFGSNYQSALYPKADGSWVILREPSLRLRAAYGQAGVQPARGASLSLYGPAQGIVGGAPTVGDTVQTIGNAGLKPERQIEVEGGVDLSAFHNRLSVEITAYNKISHDALVYRTYPGSVDGGVTQEENLGSVRNRGIEASVTATVLDARAIEWDVTVSGSGNENRLMSLGATPAVISTFYEDTVGYPIYGWWAPTLHYADRKHTGVLVPSEVTIARTPSFQGSPIPTREAALNTSIALFNHHVRIGTQVDYRGGQKLPNILPMQTFGPNNSMAENVPHSSLLNQARDIAFVNDFQTNSGFFEHADFVRWRELSLTYTAPDQFARFLHARSAALTLAARNIALWTKYTGPDPEINGAFGGPNGSPIDAPYDQGNLPLPRSWVVRLTLGF